MTPTDQSKPIAWAFYWPDGTLRFIIDDKTRMEAWRSAHEGTIVPLVAQADNCKGDAQTA